MQTFDQALGQLVVNGELDFFQAMMCHLQPP